VKDGEDFAASIRTAQRVIPGDTVNPFNLPERHAMMPGKIKGVESFDYESRARVFCLPADAADYEDVMNDILAGKAILRYEDRTFDKEGDFHVAMVYLIPKRRAPTQADEDAAGEEEPPLKPMKLP